MNEGNKNKIIEELNKRGASNNCSRCNHSDHTLIDYSFIQLVKKPGDIALGGSHIPTVVVGCNNCGLISHHAIKALGLSDEDIKKTKDE